ncbi:MAG: peptidylprolyl isomerase, partial [Gammaproteobacteria bacterium]|nr:peptidylprolyl isomerase [Gammaproteobacteria bacterium]
EMAFRRSVRQKYYHGKPPEGELEGLRRTVANDLITRSLLLQQARREGLEPDREKIEAELDVYRQRYASSPRWQAQQPEMERRVSKYLGEQDLLQQIEAQVRAVPPPSEEELRAFYAANRDKFLEPEQDHLSLILLKVPPYAQREVWQAALARAAGLVAELRSGADFATLARANSDDESASRGGDMGYLHTGMLSPAAQGVVEALEPGAISNPVRLLDGIAIFRLEDRKLAHQQAFENVRARAGQLWERQHSDETWRTFKRQLVAKGPVRILDQSLLADLQADN